MSNIPIEEVWTMPNKYEVNGYAAITKPLILAGEAIQDLKLVFEKGKIASIEPKDSVVLDLLNADEGARMLGEVALVPINSSIAQTGVIFKSTLFDENAACHIALGPAYLNNILVNTNENLNELGMNNSAVHEDIMIGDSSINVEWEI